MKALLMLLALLAVVWWWKLRSQPRVPPTAKKPPALPQPTVRCAHCGVVLPESESMAGARGRYCSAEHRQLAEPARQT